MMPIINFTNPIAVGIALVLFVLLVFLGRHTKKSIIPGIVLFVFLFIIAGHAVELALAGEGDNISIIAFCITVDFIFILISFLMYLWIDDIEAKEFNKRSLDNSLDWFWSKL